LGRQYLKLDAIGFYHPDWVIVQKSEDGEINWIVETKGRVWEGTSAKDDAIQEWCERISEATGALWRYSSCVCFLPIFELSEWHPHEES
jgi:hypothetical protein